MQCALDSVPYLGGIISNYLVARMQSQCAIGSCKLYSAYCGIGLSTPHLVLPGLVIVTVICVRTPVTCSSKSMTFDFETSLRYFIIDSLPVLAEITYGTEASRMTASVPTVIVPVESRGALYIVLCVVFMDFSALYSSSWIGREWHIMLGLQGT